MGYRDAWRLKNTHTHKKKTLVSKARNHSGIYPSKILTFTTDIDPLQQGAVGENRAGGDAVEAVAGDGAQVRAELANVAWRKILLLSIAVDTYHTHIKQPQCRTEQSRAVQLMASPYMTM